MLLPPYANIYVILTPQSIHTYINNKYTFLHILFLFKIKSDVLNLSTADE